VPSSHFFRATDSLRYIKASISLDFILKYFPEEMDSTNSLIRYGNKVEIISLQLYPK